MVVGRLSSFWVSAYFQEGYVSSREGRSNCPLLISPCSCCIFNVKTCSRNAEPMPSAGTCGASNHIRGCWISSNGFRVRILVLDITWRSLEDFCGFGSSHIFSGAGCLQMFIDVYWVVYDCFWSENRVRCQRCNSFRKGLFDPVVLRDSDRCHCKIVWW